MSKIQNVQPTYQPNVKQVQTKPSQNPSFGFKWNDLPKEARDEVMKKIEKGAQEELKTKAGPVGWVFEKLGKSKGEIQTQIINNLFTATLAPYVIYNNPFTNKTKEDRAYLAWRQPLSAVIALAGGLPMTLAINSYLNKTYDEGLNKVIDRRWSPSKGYMKRQFKQDNNIKRPFMFLDKDTKAKFKEYVDGVEGVNGAAGVDGFKKARVNAFSQLLGEDPSTFEIDEKTKTISYIKDGKKIKVGKNIPNLTTKEELKAFLKENNFYNRTVGDLLKNEFNFEFYKPNDGKLKGNLKADVAKTELDKAKFLDFIKALGLVDSDKVDDAKLRAALSRYRQSKDAPEYAKLTLDMVFDAGKALGLFGGGKVDKAKQKLSVALSKYNETKDFSEFAKSVFGRTSKESLKKAENLLAIIGKEGSRNIERTVGEDAKETTTSLGQALHEIGYKLSPNKKGDKDLQDLMNKNIKEALEEFKGIFTEHELEGFNIKSEIPDFAKNMLERLAKRNESYSKGHMTKVTMLINIGIVMITCSILNWVYPRYMEKFHSNLAASHKNGGTK